MGSNKAILQGEVNPQGVETVAWFEWGPTLDYGNLSPSQAIGNGTSGLSVTQALIDLLPNTDYHYRIVAQNSAGTAFGADTALTTLGIVPPAVATESATVITKTGATLQGTINPNGFITNGWFEWGTTPLYGNITPKQSVGNGGGSASFQQAITGLTPSTLYHYRAVGENGWGISAGPDLTFTTLAATLNTPTVVSAAATNLTHTTATLNGTVNPNGLSSVAYFEWGASAAYGAATPAQSVGAGSTAAPVSQDINGLQVGVVYHYRIIGENSDGTSVGDDQTFIPIPYQAQAYLTSSAGNFSPGNVSIVDLATNTLIKTVTVGENPVSAAATPDGSKVYVVNSSSATISVIETSGNTVTATIPVGDTIFGSPHAIGMAPDGKQVYIGSSALWVIDTATEITVEGKLYAGSSAGGTILGSNNTITIIDLASNTIKGTLTPPGAIGKMIPFGSLIYFIQANGSQIGIIGPPTDTLKPSILVPANDIAISAR